MGPKTRRAAAARNRGGGVVARSGCRRGAGIDAKIVRQRHTIFSSSNK
jgi:hypothetical protein